MMWLADSCVVKGSGLFENKDRTTSGHRLEAYLHGPRPARFVPKQRLRFGAGCQAGFEQDRSAYDQRVEGLDATNNRAAIKYSAIRIP